MHVIPVLLDILTSISSVKVVIPNDLISDSAREIVDQRLREVEKRFQDGIPSLDPIEDLKIDNSTLKKLVRKVEALEDKLNSQKFRGVNMVEEYAKYQEKLKIEEEMKQIRKKIKESDNLILKDDLKARKRVLRRLNFTTKDNIVDMKGRVACELNTGEELVLTELIFAGFFTNLSVEQTVALLSCFVWQEKAEVTPKISEDLTGPFRQIQDIARRIGEVTKKSKLEINVEEYVALFKPDIMEVTRAWCQGASFSQICDTTSIFEGSLIRAFRRLEELLRQLMQAAKKIGNTELENKLAEGIVKN